jgi:hypothetical protein
MAHRLAGLPEEDWPSTLIKKHANEEFSALNVSNEDSGKCGSSATPQSSTRTQQKCAACTDLTSIYDGIQAPCSHHYCRKCIVQLFNSTMTDKSLFPARCCGQQIPVSLAEEFLSPDIIQRIEEKWFEFRNSDRTYCAQPSCASFIHSNLIQDDIGTCPFCLVRTCTLCKQLAHAGDCPQDFELQSTLRRAQEAGWQRCYQCRAVVELTFGCNHIT